MQSVLHVHTFWSELSIFYGISFQELILLESGLEISVKLSSVIVTVSVYLLTRASHFQVFIGCSIELLHLICHAKRCLNFVYIAMEKFLLYQLSIVSRWYLGSSVCWYWYECAVYVSVDQAPPRPPLPRDTAPPRPPPPETDDEDETSFPVPQSNQPIMVRLCYYYY